MIQGRILCLYLVKPSDSLSFIQLAQNETSYPHGTTTVASILSSISVHKNSSTASCNNMKAEVKWQKTMSFTKLFDGIYLTQVKSDLTS